MPRILAAALVIIGFCASARAASGWRLTRSQHFEIYSQSSDAGTRAALLWFEQLRGFFLEQTGLKLDHLQPVRVIAFGSVKQYEPYRLRSADGYYVGAEAQDYIVMPSIGPDEFRTVAHEYAHLIMHATGLRYPDWLKEGLADFFSTVRVHESGSELGGDFPARSQILRRRPWMQLPELLAQTGESAQPGDRESAGLFYAQSWALTDMLFLSAEYGPRFREFLTALSMGESGLETFQKVYGKTSDEVMRDVHAWVDHHGVPAIHFPGVAASSGTVEVSDVPEFVSRSLLAELLLAIGELDRSEALYRDLALEAPQDADVAAALGTIALRRGDNDGARREWKQAIEAGVNDARLCYRYAVLAGMAGLAGDDVRPALERAIALQPDFDDARYLLALLEKNTSHYEAAVVQLRAMRDITQVRRFDYWVILADALNELGRRAEAKAAADQAARYATNPGDRAHATQLAYMSQTDLAVQFTRDSEGRAHMVTTRVPHESDWNPFIETGDDMKQLQGSIKEIDCRDQATRFVVEAAGVRIVLVIEDPSRVRMRNAPAEFVCGAQEANHVTVEYAASKGKGMDGLIRGMEFQ